MGQLDDERHQSSFLSHPYSSNVKEQLSEFASKFNQQSISDYLASLGPISSITSRDQIINPDAIIAGRTYGNSEAGQLQLQKDLNILRSYAAQQESAYLEYYNSPSQQAIRDRVAGLNTDILGLSGSEGVQANQITSDPLEGIASEEEIRAQKFQNATSMMSAITGIFQTVASICQIPSIFKGMKLTDSQIAVNNAHANAINVAASGGLLGNISEFEKLSGIEIASRLSDSVSSAIQSGQSLDIASWFSDENNFSGILDTYAPDSSPHYASSFANVRKRMQKSLGSAYNQGKITAENQNSFSGLVADPTYSSDQLTQIAMLRPYMAAQAKAELARLELEATLSDWNNRYQQALSVDSAVDAANHKNEYDAQFWEDMDAEIQSAFENFKATCESLSLEFEQSINKNLLDIYLQNPNNDKGFSAAYLFRSGASASLSDYYYSNNMSEFTKMLDNQRTIISSEARYSDRFHKFKSYQPIMNIPYSRDNHWQGLNTPYRAKWKADVNKYIELLESIANSD